MCFSCKEEKFCDSKLKTMAASFQFSEFDQINCFIKFYKSKVISNRGRAVSLPMKTLNKLITQPVSSYDRVATTFSRGINSWVLQVEWKEVTMGIGWVGVLTNFSHIKSKKLVKSLLWWERHNIFHNLKTCTWNTFNL